MKTRIFTFLLPLLLAVVSVQAADEIPTDQEMAILGLVLKTHYVDGGYTVVSPEADLDVRAHAEVDKTKKRIIESLEKAGFEVATLVEKLFERNKNRIRLSLKSSPQSGYVVDYDGKYEKYFRPDGGGWEKFYKENPVARGRTKVSLPVHDEKAGVVLVYKGTQTHGRAGSGSVILYKYEQGGLKELAKVMIWIS